MKSYFSAEFFKGNRARLRQAVGNDEPIIITANGLLQRGGDSSYPFQQDASFWYLTGIDEPDVVLVMDGRSEFLIVPSRDIVRQAFDGTILADELTQASGIHDVVDERVGWKRLSQRLKQCSKLNLLVSKATRVPFFGIYTNPARRQLQTRIKRLNNKLEFIDIRPQMAHLRMIKQLPEIRAMQRAIDITIDTLNDVLAPETFSKYRYEYEIEAGLSQGFRARGARGHAFDPIVAGGQAATTIHSLKNDSLLKAPELIVVDVGAEYEHYAADISRTIAFGVPTPRQIAVYEAVLDVQNQAIERLKPGLSVRDNENMVEHDMGVKLLELELITKNDRASIRKYYPHACSHSLGLDPHDAADYRLPLAAGMVITVEPGIYIPDEAIGVRIEDDVLITETGCEVLSKRLPRRLA